MARCWILMAPIPNYKCYPGLNISSVLFLIPLTWGSGNHEGENWGCVLLSCDNIVLSSRLLTFRSNLWLYPNLNGAWEGTDAISYQPVCQPVNQSTSEPVNQSTSQPVNQSTSQPATHFNTVNVSVTFSQMQTFPFTHPPPPSSTPPSPTHRLIIRFSRFAICTDKRTPNKLSGF
jgi:hypothetical protein